MHDFAWNNSLSPGAFHLHHRELRRSCMPTDLLKRQPSNVHYLEITLFVEPRKPVGHFPNTAAASVLAPSVTEGSASRWWWWWCARESVLVFFLNWLLAAISAQVAHWRNVSGAIAGVHRCLRASVKVPAAGSFHWGPSVRIRTRRKTTEAGSETCTLNFRGNVFKKSCENLFIVSCSQMDAYVSKIKLCELKLKRRDLHHSDFFIYLWLLFIICPMSHINNTWPITREKDSWWELGGAVSHKLST